MISVGYLLIFLSVCTNLAEGMIVKLQGRKNSTNSFIFNAMIALASMLFFVLASAGRFSFSLPLLLYALPSAICYSVALIFTYYALSCGSFAITMMVVSYSVALPICYGIVFLRESAGVLSYLCFAIMALSLYLTRGDTEKETRGFSLKWLGYTITATVTSGLFAVIKKMQQLRFQETHDNEFMILSLGISVAILLVMGLVRKGSGKKVSWRTAVIALGAGFSNGITNMLTLLINTMVPLSLSSPVSTGMRIVLSFIISLVFLREKFLKRQIFGVALGAVALVLLNF